MQRKKRAVLSYTALHCVVILLRTLQLRPCHGLLEVPGAGEHGVGIRVPAHLDRALDDDRDTQQIDADGEHGDKALHPRVRSDAHCRDRLARGSGLALPGVEERDRLVVKSHGGHTVCGSTAVKAGKHRREPALELEERHGLRPHAPDSEGVGTVLDPSALVPQSVGNGGRQQQRKAAVPGVRGEIEVGILKVPDIVGDNEPNRHIGPEHIGPVLVIGGEQVDTARHTEDVDETRKGVQYVPPAAVEEHALVGGPPGTAEIAGDFQRGKRGLHIGYVGDHDVGGNDEPGEPLEPFLLTDTPFVLDHHEAYAADRGSIEFEVVEPAVHIRDGRVLLPSEKTEVREHVVDGQQCRNDDKYRESARLALSADLIEDNEPRKYKAPAQYLPQIVDLENHMSLRGCIDFVGNIP